MDSRLTVIGWHNVDSTWCFPGRHSGVRGLARQLRTLRRYTNVVPLGWALDTLRDGAPLPPRATALCWDDGYRDNLDLAVPLLEELGLPGTFFLVPGLLDGERHAWWEVIGWAFARSTVDSVRWRGLELPSRGRASPASYVRASEVLRGLTESTRQDEVDDLVARLAPDGAPGDESMFLDWNGARMLAQRGFEIGSHTMKHLNLATESPERQVADLRRSREVLSRELDVAIEMIAYPFGQPDAVSAATRTAAAEAGYSHGLTTEAGCNRPGTGATAKHRIVLDPQVGLVATGVTRALARVRRSL